VEKVVVEKTSTRLADGRELIYFDEIDEAAGEQRRVRDAPDSRDLPPTSTSSQIRHDPVLDEWVVIASHRQGRTHLPPAEQCPLCPSTPQRLTEIPADDYDVVVFENRFPSLATSVPPVPEGGGLFARRAGTGRCEVLCYTSDHDASFWRLPQRRLRTIAAVWVDRTVELSRLPGVEYVFCFENRGEEIGVTLHHPHGQIYAYPFVPPRMERALRSAERHRHRTGRCLFCELVASELAARERVVATTERFVAFVPWAPRWPFEVHVYPRRHVPDLAALSEDERGELVALHADVLRRFDGLFERPAPYIAAWHQAPVSADRELAHLSLQVLTARRSSTKLKYLAGSESGAGVFINDVMPEQAAERLRQAGD
jgi:UDPglucose--hexose-1-phosphate uridylyltransferase